MFTKKEIFKELKEARKKVNPDEVIVLRVENKTGYHKTNWYQPTRWYELPVPSPIPKNKEVCGVTNQKDFNKWWTKKELKKAMNHSKVLLLKVKKENTRKDKHQIVIKRPKAKVLKEWML